jgi:uncharacterized membrane protein
VISENKNLGEKKMGTNFQYSKTLAMEGSIMLILSLVPYVGWVLGIIGVILLLRGMKEFSNYYQDNEIYQNSLTGVKYYIVAIVALAVASAGFVVGLVLGLGTSIAIGSVIGLIVGITFLIVAFVFYVLAAMHLRKTFDTLAQKSGEHSFATAGTLLWWGSILTIVVVGLLLILVAWILAVVGFFTMRTTQQQPYASQPYGNTSPEATPSAQPSQASKYCSNCGASVEQQRT